MRVQQPRWQLLRIALLVTGLIVLVVASVVFHLNGLERGQVVVVLLCVLVWADAWIYRQDKPWLRFAAAGILTALTVHLILQ